MTMIFNSLNTSSLRKPMRTKFYAALLLISIFGLNGCKKDEVDTNAYTYISVVNASPTVSTYDVFLSGARINSAALPSGGAVPYSQRLAGSYELKFSIAGRAESVLTKTVSLPQDAYQTFFLVGRTAPFDGFMTTEEVSATSTTHAYVRFVNVSPDAPALDLAIKGGAAVVTNRAFKTASAFTPVAAGTYIFDIKETSNGTVRTATESVTIGANLYYTVLVKGLLAPAAGGLELPLSAQVMVNR